MCGVLAAGVRGWLFINGAYEAQLDLGGLTAPGSVSLLGGWFEGDELNDRSTSFTDFTVRPLGREYGPGDGAIAHDPESGFIDVERTSSWLADGVIEARFFNPYSVRDGDWSSGFLFREEGGGELHAVLVTDSARWFHYLRTGGADRDRRIADGSSKHISTARDGSNHVRIILMGGHGWLFINGVYTDTLDLSGLLQAGDVSAVGRYFEGDGVDGRSTRYEGLAVWTVGAVTAVGPAPGPTPVSRRKSCEYADANQDAHQHPPRQ